MTKDAARKPVRTVERTLNILFHVSRAGRPLTLSEISDGTSVDKATAHRLLGTLEGFSLVSRDPASREYTVGPAALQLAGAMQLSLREIALPHLTALRDETGESAALIVQRGLERVAIASVEAHHELRVVPSPNSISPVYSGASGLVFMAYMNDTDRTRIIETTGLAPVNARSISSPKLYLEEIDRVRCQGFATTCGDVTPGAAAVAAPVLGVDGRPLAVISLRGPEVRMAPDRIAKIAPLVRDAARRIGADLIGAGDSGGSGQ